VQDHDIYYILILYLIFFFSSFYFFLVFILKRKMEKIIKLTFDDNQYSSLLTNDTIKGALSVYLRNLNIQVSDYAPINENKRRSALIPTLSELKEDILIAKITNYDFWGVIKQALFEHKDRVTFDNLDDDILEELNNAGYKYETAKITEKEKEISRTIIYLK